MLRFADIMLGENGATRCRRCGPAGVATVRDAAEVIAEIREVSISWGSGPGPNLSLAGAEPFRHPHFAEIVAACIEAGARRIRLDSDAVALASGDAATTAIDNGIRHLQFTLLGSTAPLHDSRCGAAGAFDDTLRGVQAFATAASDSKAPVMISAHIPVCRHNLQDAPSIVTAAAKAGVSRVSVKLADPHLALLTAAPWVSAACDTGIVNATWVEVEGVPFCLAAGWELHLASIYRPIAGSKTAVCDSCALNGVCGGATPGAGAEVVSAFRPPADADRLAARINRGFKPAVSDHE